MAAKRCSKCGVYEDEKGMIYIDPKSSCFTFDTPDGYPEPQGDHDWQKVVPDPDCKACRGEGSYYEDVAGDGGSRMEMSCDCDIPEPDCPICGEAVSDCTCRHATCECGHSHQDHYPGTEDCDVKTCRCRKFVRAHGPDPKDFDPTDAELSAYYGPQ